MRTSPFDPGTLSRSVFAVPPMARKANGTIDAKENAKIISYLEKGGVRSLLYGGNAVFYHLSIAEYSGVLQMLHSAAAPETTVVPSIGPAFGFAMDQISILRQFAFPTAMLLPQSEVADPQGIATGIRKLAEAYGKPLVLYLKFDRWLDPPLIQSLHREGVLAWIKYAVVRDDPAHDDYLKELLDVFPAERVVSGIGEQPAIVHLRDFGIAGFTSGCVCIAPEQSMQMLAAIQAGDYQKAEAIRHWFSTLEDVRNEIHPIRVLHHAVELAGIAKTGPLVSLLSDLDSSTIDRIGQAVTHMQTTPIES